MNRTNLFFSVIIGALCVNVFADIKIPKDKKEQVKLVNQYLKLQESYSLKICRPNVEEDFSRLNNDYKGFGKFIPLGIDDKLDQRTIKSHMHLFDEKEKWISWNIERLRMNKDFTVTFNLIKQLKSELKELVQLNHKHYFAKDSEKSVIEALAHDKFQNYLRDFKFLIEQVPFLLSFNYPVDHLELRRNYEALKNIKSKEAKLKSNSIFFFRRIVQDGMYDESMTKNDSVLRAAIDTFMLSMTKNRNSPFLSENERYDSIYLLKAIDSYLDNGADKLLARLIIWQERNRQIREFYRNLLENKILRDGEFQTVGKLLEDKARATYVLKDFVLKKEAESYYYWSKEAEIFQALFALETILYSEVGTLDGRDASERREISQVVLNRFQTPKYNHLGSDDSIYEYLKNLGIEPDKKTKLIENNPWLNVLFKEGEFSFTYFYIDGNFHIYCPEMTRSGQFLRRENVRLALETLANANKNYKGLRYYSRYSMQGRIEMDSVWQEYKSMPERPGKKSAKSQVLLKKFKAGKFTFFYEFTTEKNIQYLVVEIDSKVYVIKKDSPKEVYNYRNPHMFKFFQSL